MSSKETIIILSPGFPESESDSTCLPMQQQFVRTLKEMYPQFEIVVLTFQYPYHQKSYKWFGLTVIPFGGRNKGGLQKFILRNKVNSTLRKVYQEKKIAGLLSFWYNECAYVGKKFADKYGLKHCCWILGQDAKKANKYPRLLPPRPGELVALSDFIQNEFQRNHEIKPASVIPPGVDETLLSNMQEPKDIDILGVGSLIPLKQYDIFLEIVAEIKKQLPEIVTLQVPTATYEYPAVVQNYIYKYFDLNSSEEDKKRTAAYKQEFQRQDESAKFQTIDEYLASLEIQLNIIKDDNSQIPRISQLTQKTNQFNLTTIRYTESQVEKFMKEENSYVFSASVRDKFGDSGLTAVCIIIENAATSATVDTLLMSCRVIGRNIEIFFMDHILNFLKEKGYDTVYAKYIPTAKNPQVESFYEKMGFNVNKTENGVKYYSLQTEDYQGKKVGYIKTAAVQYN